MGMAATSTSSRPCDVVDVDDGAVGQVRVEQRGLGGEVALHRAVEVEVVAAEVGEDRHREAGAVDPVHREGVRRDLHRDGPPALVGQLGQAGLQLGGLGRRGEPVRVPITPVDHAGRVEDRGDERCGRRLAVRARDTDRRHPLRRVVRTAWPPAGPWRGGCRGRRPAAAPRSSAWSTSRLAGSGRHRRAGEAVPVVVLTSEAAEEVARLDAAGVEAIPPMLADASPTILAATTGVPSSSAATVMSAPVLTAGRERPCRCHRWTWAGPAGGPGPRGRRP